MRLIWKESKQQQLAILLTRGNIELFVASLSFTRFPHFVFFFA
jgi:hypothetical protein